MPRSEEDRGNHADTNPTEQGRPTEISRSDDLSLPGYPKIF